MPRNPYHITYKDLITFSEARVKWMEANYPRMKLERRISADTATHNLECGKKILQMLKKQEKNRQLSLGDLFEQKP